MRRRQKLWEETAPPGLGNFLFVSQVIGGGLRGFRPFKAKPAGYIGGARVYKGRNNIGPSKFSALLKEYVGMGFLGDFMLDVTQEPHHVNAFEDLRPLPSQPTERAAGPAMDITRADTGSGSGSSGIPATVVLDPRRGREQPSKGSAASSRRRSMES
jgi:hypothetical protein